MSCRRLLALAAVLSTLPAAASASPLSIYGTGARGLALAGAQTAGADDATAAFYNPALLTRPEQVTFGFGIQYVRPNLSVRPLAASFGDESQPALPADFAQWTLGLVFPLGGKVRNRLALGIGLSLPNGYVVKVDALDARRPYFYMFQSSAEKIVILPGFAFRVTDWLSVGAGLQVLANLGGSVDVQADLFAQRVESRSMEMALTTREALTAGVALGPFEGLTVGASFRQELGLDYAIPARIALEDVGVLDLNLVGSAVWSPHELSVGAAWDVPGARTTVTLDLVYALWSRAPNPQLMVVLDTGGAVLDGFGLGDALDLCSEQETEAGGCLPTSPGFIDNLSPKVGVEHRVSEVLTLRGGWWYWPTPVPNQVGRTNYLDASSHHLALGVGLTFRDPLDVFAQPITVDLAGEAALLADRAVDKGSDGRVDYAFGGSLFQLAASVRYRY